MAISTKRKSRVPLIGALAALALAAGLAFAIMRAQAPAQGVRPIIWDRESCSHCAMTISDHRFACQLQTKGGETYDFDDPGCLLTYVARKHPQVGAIYFHALNGETWIKAPDAAFVNGQNTPMGYGLGAVPAGTRGAVSLDDARRIAQAHDAGMASAAHEGDEVMR